MSQNELIKSQSELEKLADKMSQEVGHNWNVVSRYISVIFDTAVFREGTEHGWVRSEFSLNREDMENGVYTQFGHDILFPQNFDEATVARDLQKHRFHFTPKGIPLPTEESITIEPIPQDIRIYDQELKEFSRDHKNTRLSRYLAVTQSIVVNSKGGIAIQSIPLFGIGYNEGFQPLPTSRDISAVCNSDKDVKGLTRMIKYIADPTPDKRVKSSKSFGEAFDKLFKVSGLKFGSLQDAGIPLSELYDVVMLTGVPIHEIFGHHFEEPIRQLDFGESGTFKYGQNIQNKDIILQDNPNQTIEGFRVQGFTYTDAYGRKREPRLHIKDGKVIGFLGSEYADQENLMTFLNLKKSSFVGNAIMTQDGHFPQPRMSCTVIDGKSQDVDLEGKLLLVPHEGHTQPTDKTYMVKSYESYVVKDGQPVRLIPLQVTGGINQALSNIVLLNNWSYQTGMCGKPEPIYYPNSRGSASAPVSQFAKSQIWAGQQVYPLPISDTHLRILTSLKK